MSKKNINKIFERVDLLLKKKGMTQKELSNICGFGVTTISNWKSGFRQIANKSLVKIAEALEVSVEYLKGEPERLTQSQSNLAIACSHQLEALQKYLGRVLSDPAWAENEWKIVEEIGRLRLEQEDQRESQQ